MAELKKRNGFVNIILVIIVLIVLVGATCLILYFNLKKSDESAESPSPSPQNINQNKTDISKWKNFRNERYGFEMMYPESGEIKNRNTSVFGADTNIADIYINSPLTELEIKENKDNNIKNAIQGAVVKYLLNIGVSANKSFTPLKDWINQRYAITGEEVAIKFRSAIKISQTKTIDGVSRDCKVWFIDKGRNVVSVGFCALDELLSLKSGEFEEILSTLKFFNDDLLKQARDSTRASDAAGMNSTFGLYLAVMAEPVLCPDGKVFKSTLGSRKVDGTGYIPIDLEQITGGSPLSNYPIDPINDDDYNYSIVCDTKSNTYEINLIFESSKYNYDLALPAKDGGDNPNVYEIGTDPGLDLIH